MQAALLLFFGGLVGFSYAQSFNGLPACARPCVMNYLNGGQFAGCNALDIACICNNGNFIAGIACCLAAACDAADQASATTYAQNLCKSNGITDLPTAVSCASTKTSSTTSSSSLATTSISTSTSASSNSTTVKTASLTSTLTSSSVSSLASSSVSSTSSAAAKTGGAIQNMAGMGGLAAVALAVVL